MNIFKQGQIVFPELFNPPRAKTPPGRSRLVFGIGLRNFVIADGQPPHNSFVTALVEFGLWGMCALVWLSGYMLVRSWFLALILRNSRQTLLFALVVMTVVMMMKNL